MRSQRGNIIVYLLVGIVLFSALIGTMWWVKNRVATTPAPVATTEQTQKSGTETKVDQDSKPETTNEQTNTGSAEEQKPDTSQTTTPPSTSTQPGSGSGASSNTTLPPESQTPRTGPAPSNVAASGPIENAMGTSLGLGIITYLASSFVRSRKSAH